MWMSIKKQLFYDLFYLYLKKLERCHRGAKICGKMFVRASKLLDFHWDSSTTEYRRQHCILREVSGCYSGKLNYKLIYMFISICVTRTYLLGLLWLHQETTRQRCMQKACQATIQTYEPISKETGPTTLGRSILHIKHQWCHDIIMN